MTDVLAYLVAGVALGFILAPKIPTGFLGTLGLLMIGVAASISVEDRAFDDVRWMQNIMVFMMVGFVLLAVFVLLRMLHKASHQPAKRKWFRRGEDWLDTVPPPKHPGTARHA